MYAFSEDIRDIVVYCVFIHCALVLSNSILPKYDVIYR